LGQYPDKPLDGYVIVVLTVVVLAGVAPVVASVVAGWVVPDVSIAVTVKLLTLAFTVTFPAETVAPSIGEAISTVGVPAVDAVVATTAVGVGVPLVEVVVHPDMSTPAVMMISMTTVHVRKDSARVVDNHERVHEGPLYFYA
jgi:hypothetical protein